MEKFDSVDVDLALSELLRNKLTALIPGSIKFNNTLGLKWRNSQAVQKVYQISATIGRLPDLYDSQIGGQAIWLYPKSKTGKFYDEFLVKDVVHFHTRPGLHPVYFMVTITMPLKITTRDQLIRVTETGSYNQVSQQLTVGCHFLGAIILTFYVIARLDSGEISIEEAISIYSAMIPLLSEENREIEASADMKSVDTPITDTLEKYVFGKTNTKLSRSMFENRSVKSVNQSEIMMMTDLLPSETSLAPAPLARPADAATSSGSRLPIATSLAPPPVSPRLVSASSTRPADAAMSSGVTFVTPLPPPTTVGPASAAYRQQNV